MIVSNSKFNRRAKIQRWLKVMAGWPVMAFMVWLSYDSITELTNLNDSLGGIQKVKLSGVVNNVSAFVGFLIFGFISVLPLAMLHPSIEWLLKAPFSTKVGQYTVAAFVLACAGYGIWLDSHIREKLRQYNYVECHSERELTLKYSSRSYVLPPATCD